MVVPPSEPPLNEPWESLYWTEAGSWFSNSPGPD